LSNSLSISPRQAKARRAWARSACKSSACAFDLLELDGQDLRREPLEVRKATLASVLRGCRSGLQFNQHLAYPGDVVFAHACKMGLEGIVSKRPIEVLKSEPRFSFEVISTDFS
jgi:bifunctional non-homologous end joining protein LigD